MKPYKPYQLVAVEGLPLFEWNVQCIVMQLQGGSMNGPMQAVHNTPPDGRYISCSKQQTTTCNTSGLLANSHPAAGRHWRLQCHGDCGMVATAGLISSGHSARIIGPHIFCTPCTVLLASGSRAPGTVCQLCDNCELHIWDQTCQADTRCSQNRSIVEVIAVL